LPLNGNRYGGLQDAAQRAAECAEYAHVVVVVAQALKLEHYFNNIGVRSFIQTGAPQVIPDSVASFASLAVGTLFGTVLQITDFWG
jgi:hypothetical protein